MPTYNGHKNWNHWNVALWIGNDEGLYNLARWAVENSDNKDQAACAILAELEDQGINKTPDGAPYSFSSIRAALRDL